MRAHTLDDDDFYDDGEMYWEIVNREIDDTISVQELDEAEEDQPEE